MNPLNVGVETDRPDGTIRAPVVVVAEGANSLVSDGAGLRDHHAREDVAVAAKEVLEFAGAEVAKAELEDD